MHHSIPIYISSTTTNQQHADNKTTTNYRLFPTLLTFGAGVATANLVDRYIRNKRYVYIEGRMVDRKCVATAHVIENPNVGGGYNLFVYYKSIEGCYARDFNVYYQLYWTALHDLKKVVPMT